MENNECEFQSLGCGIVWQNLLCKKKKKIGLKKKQLIHLSIWRKKFANFANKLEKKISWNSPTVYEKKKMDDICQWATEKICKIHCQLYEKENQ